MADGGPSPLGDGDRRGRDHVRLGLPTGGPAAALARASVVTLGRQAGFGRAVLGAVTLAVDEALVLVLPMTTGGVDLDVMVSDGALTIIISPRHPDTTPDPGAVARFEDVVADLVTSATVDRSSGVVSFEVRTSPDPTEGDPRRGE